MWDEEMIPADYEFLSRHKDTFRRMWIEQVNIIYALALITCIDDMCGFKKKRKKKKERVEINSLV
jgi:hypothetical protein